MAQKLYQFSVLDSFERSKYDILRALEQNLITEAELQGWAEGYELRLVEEPVKITPEQTEYRFEVYGRYLDDMGKPVAEENTPDETSEAALAARQAEV